MEQTERESLDHDNCSNHLYIYRNCLYYVTKELLLFLLFYYVDDNKQEKPFRDTLKRHEEASKAP